MVAFRSTRTRAGSTVGVALAVARSYTAVALAGPTVMVAIGSSEGTPFTCGCGRILMTAPAPVAVDVTAAAVVSTFDSDAPRDTSSVLVLSTLVSSVLSVVWAPSGSAPVIGFKVSARVWIGSALMAWVSAVLADRPRLVTDPTASAVGLPAWTAAALCEQAMPRSTSAVTWAGRLTGAHVRGELADWPSAVTSECAGATLV